MSGRMANIAAILETDAPLMPRDRALLHDVCNRITSGEFRLRVQHARPASNRAGRREHVRLAVEYCNTSLAHLTSKNAKAECVRRKTLAYAASAWPRERALTGPPTGPHAPFWKMLRAFADVPSVKTIVRGLK